MQLMHTFLPTDTTTTVKVYFEMKCDPSCSTFGDFLCRVRWSKHPLHAQRKEVDGGKVLSWQRLSVNVKGLLRKTLQNSNEPF